MDNATKTIKSERRIIYTNQEEITFYKGKSFEAVSSWTNSWSGEKEDNYWETIILEWINPPSTKPLTNFRTDYKYKSGTDVAGQVKYPSAAYSACSFPVTTERTHEVLKNNSLRLEKYAPSHDDNPPEFYFEFQTFN